MKKTTAILSITLAAAALFSLFLASSCTVDADASKTLYFYALAAKQDPETVTNLRVIEGKESAMLVWDSAIYESTKYSISYRKTSELEADAITVTVENPKKYYYKSLYNLENDCEYTFSVTAVQSTGRVSETKSVATTPKEKLAVKAKPSDTTTTEIELEAVPDKPNDFVWCRMMTPESYETYLIDGNLDGKTYYSNPGDNTNGIFAVGSIYQLKGDGNLIENNVGALDRLMIQNSAVVKNNLRDGEGVHWFTIRRVGAHWEIYGYLYNKKFEESILSGTVAVEEKTSSDVVWFDTVKDMEECDIIYHNSTTDSYNGVTVKTRGYKAARDGGAATYSTQTRETYINKRSRPHYYKYLDHRTSTGQIMAYIPGNIECDVDGDGMAESVPGANIRQLGAGK